MLTAYEGDQPYIFISYSHKNSTLVRSVIGHLQQEGFRVWFDAGIEAGTEWPEYIAEHLSNCQCMLAFLSPEFVESDNCRRELNFALDLKKPVLNIYIDDVQLSSGMRMQLGLSQAMFRKNCADDETFFRSIADARIIAPCKEAKSAPKPEPKPESQPEPKPVPKDVTPKEAPAQAPEGAVKVTARNTPKTPEAAPAQTAPPKADYKKRFPGRTKALKWILFLWEFAYIAACIYGTGYATEELEWWEAVLVLAAIHPIMFLVSRLIRFIGCRPMPEADTDIAAFCVISAAASTLLAIFIATPFVAFFDSIILQFLCSLGLNILPTLLCGLIFIFLL